MIVTEMINAKINIDIEGGEYELLDEISSYSKNLTGLNIEFHNVQDNLEPSKTAQNGFRDTKMWSVEISSVRGPE